MPGKCKELVNVKSFESKMPETSSWTDLAYDLA